MSVGVRDPILIIFLYRYTSPLCDDINKISIQLFPTLPSNEACVEEDGTFFFFFFRVVVLDTVRQELRRGRDESHHAELLFLYRQK